MRRPTAPVKKSTSSCAPATPLVTWWMPVMPKSMRRLPDPRFGGDAFCTERYQRAAAATRFGVERPRDPRPAGSAGDAGLGGDVVVAGGGRAALADDAHVVGEAVGERDAGVEQPVEKLGQP